ncbi:peptide/nickel transport system permease protein [Nocardioides albertanoniae]|uniref:Peptide/nickel transport system permease protein n=1 Tax=Nocardioides albertanoniae TaxID=1175486 RepID=A0A543A616_9ACTN|nr:ABC transporter permease [Nocardioides albertanoniae]TQL67997.1 peptide/nickel transport system permease protein [Nocardioides albertanoniae]
MEGVGLLSTTSTLARVGAVGRHPGARRAGEAVVTLLGVSLFTFVLLRVVPGDQISAAYGTAAGDLSPAQLRALESYYGINEPLVSQYLGWLGGVLTGNLGVSTTSHLSVLSMTAQALPITIELAVLAIVIGVVLGVPGGMLAASRPGRARDQVSQLTSLVALSVPSFLLAAAVSSWLVDTIGWYPNGEGFRTLGEDLGLNLQQMLLPALVLGISIAPPILQTTRAAILTVRSEDYIRTARAKGVAGRRLQVRHILRNALIPVLTMSGLQFGFLLGGALVAEQIFAIPGIGRQVLLGLEQKEYAVVQSTVLVIAAMFVLVNLLTDVLYRLVDPRVRVE